MERFNMLIAVLICIAFITTVESCNSMQNKRFDTIRDIIINQQNILASEKLPEHVKKTMNDTLEKKFDELK